MTDIVKLRADYIAATEKAARAQQYFEAGRARHRERNRARKAAERAANAYFAAALGDTRQEILVAPRPPPSRRTKQPDPMEQFFSHQAANDNFGNAHDTRYRHDTADYPFDIT